MSLVINELIAITQLLHRAHYPVFYTLLLISITSYNMNRPLFLSNPLLLMSFLAVGGQPGESTKYKNTVCRLYVKDISPLNTYALHQHQTTRS